MSRLPTDFVVLLLCWAGPLTASYPDVTNYTLDLLSMYSGNFSNVKQIQNGSKELASLQLILYPVDIIALRPAPVVYNELTVDGEVEDVLIIVFSERPGPSIYGTIYSITRNPSSYKPGQFDPSTLRDLKLKDLPASNCTAVYKRLGKAVYVGSFPDCTQLINGNYANFADTVACEDYSTIVPPTLPYFSKTPYILERQGDRFPLIGLQDNYDSICGSRQSPPVTPRY